PAPPHRVVRPPALGSRPHSDDLPSPPLAASIRQNIPFPAAPPAHPGACEHWHDITDQSPIRPSNTAAATTPLASPALSSWRSSQTHPPLQPLRRQIAIVGQALTAFPRVPSSEGFRTSAPLARVDRSRWAGIRNPNRKRSSGPSPSRGQVRLIADPF